MLNAIGLANVGLETFLAEKLPLLRKPPCHRPGQHQVIVAGHSIEDYVATAGATSPPSPRSTPLVLNVS